MCYGDRMKDILKSFFVFSLIPLFVISAERPPQKLPTFMQMIQEETNKQNTQELRKYLARLPQDVRRIVFVEHLLSLYPNITKMAQQINALKDIVTPNMLLELFEKLPYTSNAITLANFLKQLQLPLIQNSAVQDWLRIASSKLVMGYELYVAGLRNNEKEIKRLLENKNIDLNWKSHYEFQRPLISAMRNKNLSIVKLLLNAGTDPNIIRYSLPILRDESYSSYLDRQTNACKLLLSAGAEVDGQDNHGKTALISACEYGDDNNFLMCNVKELLAAGADPNVQDNSGKTALIYASTNPLHIMGWNGPIEKIQLLLAYGANPNIQDRNGESALFYSFEFTDGKITQLLLEHGANPNIQDNEGNTALMASIILSHRRIRNWHGPIAPVEYLLAHGANPDIINNAGQTARDIAVQKHFDEIVKLLDEASAARQKGQAAGCVVQ